MLAHKHEASSVATPDLWPVWKAARPFAVGSAAGCFATACIQPMDMIKVRIQLQAGVAGATTSPFKIAAKMISEEGFSSLYAGLSAGLTRQVIYTGARLGLYDQLTEMSKTRNDDGKPLPLRQTAACALTAGGVAAVLGNPADLSLVRMQADSMLPKAQQRGYSSVVAALSGIVRQEGFLALFKGAAPTATRAMALNLGMLGGNSEAKKHLAALGVQGNALVFSASAIAGFFASAFSLPFDFVKTALQKQGTAFTGPLDCVTKTLAAGGPLRFYAGFPTYYFRIAPHAMLTLIAADKIKAALK
jgi:solute carrier family 25 oxoglutarate transporter 11